MALQGNLHDFSVMEILQLLGSQRKTGCLLLEWNTERAQIHVSDGRIVSTRQTGMKPDDPLLLFLIKVHRLSDEQRRGILSIHKESNRDLEDLLITGRYLDAEELKGFIERQILNDLTRVVRWENGTYRFDPNILWPAPLVRLSMEGATIEAARRGDESRRFAGRFKNPHELLGVRDFPDPDEPLSEEERDLFGLIDGLHTLAEVVAAAPLAEYEAYESLDRMMEAEWLEVVGSRDPGTPPPPPRNAAPPKPKSKTGREVLTGVLVVAAVAGLRLGAPRVLHPVPIAQREVYAAAQTDQIRDALDLYRREKGLYPGELKTLVDEDWMDAFETRVQGYRLEYHAEADGQSYVLKAEPDLPGR